VGAVEVAPGWLSRKKENLSTPRFFTPRCSILAYRSPSKEGAADNRIWDDDGA
jgi:hypothetical protein